MRDAWLSTRYFVLDRSADRSTRSLVRFVIFTLGLSSVVAQLTLLRELLMAFHGNELALGVFLGNWLLLTGLGAALGRRASHNRRLEWRVIVGQIWTGIAPISGLILLRAFRDTFFLRGAEVGAQGALLTSLAILAPYCLISGYLLTAGVALLSSTEEGKGLGTVYIADSVGSVVGGVLFTYVLVRLLDHFAMLWCVGSLNLIAATVCAFSWRKKRRFIIGVLAGAMWLLLGVSGLDAWSTRRQFRGLEVVFVRNSPYGRVVLTRSDGQLNLTETGVPTPLAGEKARTEETTLCALAQRPTAKNALLLGGGVSGTARFLLTQGLRHVTYVELDPLILEIGRKFAPDSLADERINAIAADGRRFLRSTTNSYDLVIIDTPDPVTAQLNRFYTVESFRQLKKALAPDGVVSFGIGRYENVVSPELAAVLSTVYRSLSEVFGRVLILPLNRVYFVASDGELHGEIAERLQNLPQPAEWMKPSYLRVMLNDDRLSDMQRIVREAAVTNTDFRPVLYFQHLRHWLSQFGALPRPPVALVILVMLVYLLRMGAVARAVLASGTAASSIQVVLLLAVQVACGALYQQLGLVVAVFMAGLAFGGWFGRDVLIIAPGRCLGLLVVGIGLYAGLLPWILKLLISFEQSYFRTGSSMAVLLGLTFVIAGLVGTVFPVAGRLLGSSFVTSASRLYTADFVGAWLGAVLAGSVLIPTIGVTGICGTVAAISILCGLGVMITKRQR